MAKVVIVRHKYVFLYEHLKKPSYVCNNRRASADIGPGRTNAQSCNGLPANKPGAGTTFNPEFSTTTMLIIVSSESVKNYILPNTAVKPCIDRNDKT